MLTRKRLSGDRRIFEWVLLLLLLGVVAAALLDKARDMRGRAELGAFQYSLGALRASLAVEQVRAISRGGPAAQTNTNPFLLLDHRPSNYSGELAVTEAQAGAAAKGSWFYDRHCHCVGYRPADERRFIAPSGAIVMLFGRSNLGGAPNSISVEVLAAHESYLWWGESIR